MATRRKRTALPFVQIHYWLLRSAAWRDLSPAARATYLELKALYNGTNNGTLGLGAREAGDLMNLSKDTGNRALRELEAHGFVRRTKDSSFGQKKMTIEWALTEVFDNSTNLPATKDFMRWPSNGGASQSAGEQAQASVRPPAVSSARLGTSDIIGPASAEKQKPVSKPGASVSSLRLAVAKRAATEPNSLGGETVNIKTGDSQSHRRDTYTSAPGGTLSNAFRAARDIVSAYLAEGDVEDADWIGPTSYHIAERLLDDWSTDPLISAVVAIFPDAMPCVEPQAIERHLQALPSNSL